MSDIYKIDVDTSTGAQLPAQARAELMFDCEYCDEWKD